MQQVGTGMIQYGRLSPLPVNLRLNRITDT
jgi:hypothetical protein